MSRSSSSDSVNLTSCRQIVVFPPSAHPRKRSFCFGGDADGGEGESKAGEESELDGRADLAFDWFVPIKQLNAEKKNGIGVVFGETVERNDQMNNRFTARSLSRRPRSSSASLSPFLCVSETFREYFHC